jgi:branched-chain amino acid transport system permease protein
VTIETPTPSTGAGRWRAAVPSLSLGGDRGKKLRPPTYRRHQYLAAIAFIVVVGLVAPRVVTSPANQNLLDLWLAYSIAAIGFYWVFGLAGRFAFCQTFMMLFGAYTSAWVTRELGPQWFLLGLVAAMAVTAVFALLIGAATARAQDFYFAIGTLAVTEIGLTVFPLLTSFTGPGGETIGVSPPQIGDTVLISQIDVFWLSLVIIAIVLLVGMTIERSPVAREAIASRDNAMVSKTLGIPLTRIQLQLFMLGSAAGGLSGALIGHSTGNVSTDSYGINLAIGIFLMLLLGGVNSIWGPILGAGFYVLAPHILASFQNYETIIYGGLLLVIVIALPEGLIGAVERIYNRVRHRPGAPGPGPVERMSGYLPATQTDE